jgi:hypothetical protein
LHEGVLLVLLRHAGVADQHCETLLRFAIDSQLRFATRKEADRRQR